MYADEIKGFLSGLSIPSMTFDPIVAVFAVLMIVGASAFVVNEISRLRKKEKMAAPSGVEIDGKYFNSQLYLTEQLGHLGPLLAKSKQRLWMMGVSLSKFAIDQRSTVPKLLERGVAVRFLLLKVDEPNVKGPDLAGKFVEVTGAPNTKSGITDSLALLKDLKAKYPMKLEVRQHGSLPFHSMVVVDDSFIQVGFYLYKTGPPDRPQAIVSKSLHPEIFEHLLNSYNAVWDIAESV
jgi:hypothetical protein